MRRLPVPPPCGAHLARIRCLRAPPGMSDTSTSAPSARGPPRGGPQHPATSAWSTPRTELGWRIKSAVLASKGDGVPHERRARPQPYRPGWPRSGQRGANVGASGHASPERPPPSGGGVITGPGSRQSLVASLERKDTGSLLDPNAGRRAAACAGSPLEFDRPSHASIH